MNITATNITSRCLELQWNQPHSNNAPIQGYRFMHSVPKFLNQSEFVTDVPTSTASVVNLHPGVIYNFTVLAFNAIGLSEPSDTAMVQTHEECKFIGC